jgi:hypothetical protein
MQLRLHHRDSLPAWLPDDAATRKLAHWWKRATGL